MKVGVCSVSRCGVAICKICIKDVEKCKLESEKLQKKQKNKKKLVFCNEKLYNGKGQKQSMARSFVFSLIALFYEKIKFLR